MKKWILFLMIPVLMVSACDKGGSDDDTVKIGFLLKTMQEERYQRDKAAFLAKGEELGAEVIFDSAGNDEQDQMSKFENMLAQGVDAIVLQPVNTGTAGLMVQMAHDEGVPVVGYDSLLRDGPLDVMVMQDSWAVGRLQAEAMVEWLKEKKGEVAGNIMLIRGQPGDNNAAAMSEGVIEIVQEYPDLDLVVDQAHENWAADKAMDTTENALTRFDNDIDAIICNNSGMASGVISALEAQGLADKDKLFVAGSDADLVNIQYVAEGKQTVEIWKKIDPLAEKAAEIAYRLATAEDLDAAIAELEVDRYEDNGFAEIPTIVTPIVPVTQDNIDETVIAGGFYTEQEVYGE